MLDFSIIIPVYNGANTIARCLDSITAQTFDRFEVLVMDDGSGDDSPQLLARYQQRDRRVRVLRQENRGPSAARNRCLEQAAGDWICFVDCDDTVAPDYLAQLHRIIESEQPDAVFLGYRQMEEAGNVIGVHLPGPASGGLRKTLLSLSERDMFGYTWIKAVRRQVIGEIRFREDLDLFEDEVFTCQVMGRCGRVSTLDAPVYDYYTGSGSALTGRTHQDYCRKCDQVFSAWMELLGSEESDALLKKAEAFAVRCRYYGFERNVRLKPFFSDLAQTGYFMMRSGSTAFDCHVRNRRYGLLWLDKRIYLGKVWLSRLLGGGK